jgi:uncharacterized membrane protein YtjA (UPF0391 family)
LSFLTWDQISGLIGFSGLAATTVLAATFFVTTALAPMMASSAIVTPGIMIAPPIHTRLPTLMVFAVSKPEQQCFAL